jgi:hypothetical protein
MPRTPGRAGAKNTSETFASIFGIVRRVWTPKNETNKREAIAREQLKKLFGD